MSLIAIDRSLHLYLVTNFSFTVKLCWLYVYVNFGVAVEGKKILMKKTSSHVPIGLLRQQKANFKKKSQLSIQAVPKKKQNKTKKNNGFRPQPFSFEEQRPRKLLAGKVSLLVLSLSGTIAFRSSAPGPGCTFTFPSNV